MKPSPFWKTYAALAVLAGLGAYIYFVESRHEAKPEKPKQKVFTLEKAKVQSLTLAPREGEAIRLVKEGKAWKLAAPLTAPADDNAVDSMLGSLESLTIDEVALESGANLADFGLEKPKLSVSVLIEGASEPLKLLLGDKTPEGSGLYAKLPAQPRVFTIASYLESSLDKKPFDLRDRDLLHVKRDAVKTLEIAGPEGGYALARSDKGEWAFTKPLATRAGRWSVDGLAGTLESLRMESVAAEEAKDLRPFGLDKPARSVALGLADGGSKTLEIGSAVVEKDKAQGIDAAKDQKDASRQKPTKYYARDASAPLVGVIPSALVDDLAKGMGELRAKRLLEVATYEVEGFEVELEGGKRAYARSSAKGKDGFDDHKWKRTSPDAKDLETNKVQDVLFKLGGVEVQEFLDAPGPAAGYGFEPPVLKVTLRFEVGKPAAWFELGMKDGGAYARRADDASVLKLDPARAEELIKAFKEL